MQPRLCSLIAATFLFAVFIIPEQSGHPALGRRPLLAIPLSNSLAARIAALQERFEGLTFAAKDPPDALFHALRAFGHDFEVQTETGEGVSFRDHWLHHFDTQIRALDGLEFYGEAHPGQFLFKLMEASECNGIRVRAQDQELGWDELVLALLCGCHDLSDTDYVISVIANDTRISHWTNRFGENWTFDRLIQAHLRRRFEASTCGGTHWRYGLASLALAPAISIARRREIEAVLKEELASALANMDEYGQIRPALHDDQSLPVGEMISYHAHSLEWLLLAYRSGHLSTDNLHRAAEWLAEFTVTYWDSLEIRQLSHAITALRMYRELSESNANDDVDLRSAP